MRRSLVPFGGGGRLAVSGGGHGDTNGEENGAVAAETPTLPPPVIGQIATFAQQASASSPLSNAQLKLLVAHGPVESRAIRVAALSGNLGYLRRRLLSKTVIMIPSTSSFPTFVRRRAKIRDDFAAWAAANPDWRQRHCSKGLEVANRHVVLGANCCLDAVFNNPFIAILLGQLDILKNLVEVTGIDVNDILWSGKEGVPLLWVAMSCGDVDIIEYLLSIDEIDLNPPIRIRGSEARMLPTTMVAAGSGDMCQCVRSFECLIRHPRNDPNALLAIDDLPSDRLTLLQWAVRLYINDLTLNKETMLQIIKTLLKAGGDPNLPGEIEASPLSLASQGIAESQPGTDERTAAVRVKMVLQGFDIDGAVEDSSAGCGRWFRRRWRRGS